MVERLVDVLNSKQTVLHTFPVTVDGPEDALEDTKFEQKAATAAAYAQLVPADEHKELKTKMHVGRGGSVSPYGDPAGVMAETKEGLEQAVRECAYQLWEQAGRPEGRADEFWHRAHEQRLRERAYILWELEGCPDGRADEYWLRTLDFEK